VSATRQLIRFAICAGKLAGRFLKMLGSFRLWSANQNLKRGKMA